MGLTVQSSHGLLCLRNPHLSSCIRSPIYPRMRKVTTLCNSAISKFDRIVIPKVFAASTAGMATEETLSTKDSVTETDMASDKGINITEVKSHESYEMIEPPPSQPPPPEQPEPGDCCGSGCVRCVWDVYYEDLEAYNMKYGANFKRS